MTPEAINVRSHGAVGDGVTDDTAAIQSCFTEARGDGRFRSVFLPAGTYLVSSPVEWLNGCSIVGEGTSVGGVPDLSSRIKAAPGFVGTDILRYVNADSQVDNSWHWGSISKLAVEGNGSAGPRGINPGSMGENAAIRDVLVSGCSSGFYLAGEQATAHLANLAAHGCTYGLHIDGLQSTVRVVGISGDNNTHLVHYSGGVSANVTIIGMKAESYEAGTGDPLILVDNLDGGSLTIVGGWCDTSGARSQVIQLQRSTATAHPRITLLGFAANSLYTDLINDTIGSKTLAVQPNGLASPAVFWNLSAVMGGQGSQLLENGVAFRGRDSAGAYQAIFVASTDNSTQVRALGSGGGKLSALGGTADAFRWSSDGGSLGFYGATPVAKQATVPVTAEGVHAALVALGLIA